MEPRDALLAVAAFAGSYLGQRVTRSTLAQLVRDAVHAELRGKDGVLSRIAALEERGTRYLRELVRLRGRVRRLEPEGGASHVK
ncbi:hypothetical protein [Archangium violaceum]|uniref:hypothetical protein n=1 Tax=Archangium violaceum TaxID=83451 RepID=UPI001EF503A6|nr:hypothetical protein [Archangium violaceum]